MSFSKKVAFHTLGCKVNQYETESIKNQLIKRGYEEVPFEDKSDIYIINSCTVTSIADRKTRNMLRRAKKINPEAKVIVTGCYAQTNSREILEIEDTTASMPPTHVGEKTEMEYPQDMDITKQIISGITRLRIPSIMIRRYLRIN